MTLRFVDFEHYCKTCKYKDTPESEDPCDDCLGQPTNDDSRKPWNYKEAE